MNIKDNKKNTNFAMDILHNLKVENKTLKIILSLSIISNILIAIILKG